MPSQLQNSTCLSRVPRVFALLASTTLALSGCVERTIRVTSDPPGAIVWLNDVEIGQTPAEARFKFHGVYDVRLELEGYTPVHEGREAKAPFYEYPGPDLVAAALPMRLHNQIEWHYVLTPAPSLADPGAEAAMLDRARALRDRLGPAPHALDQSSDPTRTAPIPTPTDPAAAPAAEPRPVAPAIRPSGT